MRSIGREEKIKCWSVEISSGVVGPADWVEFGFDGTRPVDLRWFSIALCCSSGLNVTSFKERRELKRKSRVDWETSGDHNSSRNPGGNGSSGVDDCGDDCFDRGGGSEWASIDC